MRKDTISVMSVVLLVVEAIVIVFLALSLGRVKVDKSHEYPMVATVSSIDVVNDEVTCVDANGEAWVFVGVDHYEKGDTVAMIMNSKGTNDITDDEIVQIRYSRIKVQ